MKGAKMYRFWTQTEIDYLEENWGKLAILVIAKKLGRSEESVKKKVFGLGLGPWRECSEYLSFGQLILAMGLRPDVTKRRLIENGLPIKIKTIRSEPRQFVDVDDFWKWAETHQCLLKFDKFEKGTLGKEPPWVDIKRRSDIRSKGHSKTQWTPNQDALLKSLLGAKRYTYAEVSCRLGRSEIAVKERIKKLGLTIKPLRPDNHTWTEAEVATMLKMRGEHFSYGEVAKVLGVTEIAIRSKMERLFNAEFSKKAHRSKTKEERACAVWHCMDFMDFAPARKPAPRRKAMTSSKRL